MGTDATLHFFGAAQGVTGSRYLLEAAGLRILVDCGLYQERDLRSRNWDPFPIPPSRVDAVLLTHAHLDHSGLLPKFARDGFQGPVICTAATCEIAGIALLDSARIQEEDAAFKEKRHKKEKRKGPFPEIALYSAPDVERACQRFQAVRYGQPVSLGNGVRATFRDAGHILGSASITVSFPVDGNERSIVFSGDVGRWGRPIIRDPVPPEEADYVVVESTYGDRVHENTADADAILQDAARSTAEANGNLLIPSFAIERAQEILYRLNSLLKEGRIPPSPVFLDSPMAVSVSRVMLRHQELLDEEMRDLLTNNHSPFSFPGLRMVETVEQSKAINDISGKAIIIAGSGMCTGGRIKHHLAQNISRPECAVLFVGYQAVGTLGRILADGAKEVRLFGKTQPVRARMLQIHGYSSHGDRNELMRWLSALHKTPRQIFVTHGEPEAARVFAAAVREKHGCPVSVPAYGYQVRLD